MQCKNAMHDVGYSGDGGVMGISGDDGGVGGGRGKVRLELVEVVVVQAYKNTQS